MAKGQGRGFNVPLIDDQDAAIIAPEEKDRT